MESRTKLVQSIGAFTVVPSTVLIPLLQQNLLFTLKYQFGFLIVHRRLHYHVTCQANCVKPSDLKHQLKL